MAAMVTAGTKLKTPLKTFQLNLYELETWAATQRLLTAVVTFLQQHTVKPAHS